LTQKNRIRNKFSRKGKIGGIICEISSLTRVLFPQNEYIRRFAQYKFILEKSMGVSYNMFMARVNREIAAEDKLQADILAKYGEAMRYYIATSDYSIKSVEDIEMYYTHIHCSNCGQEGGMVDKKNISKPFYCSKCGEITKKEGTTEMTLCKKCGVWYQPLGPNWVHNCNMQMKIEQPKILQSASQLNAKFEIYSEVDEKPKKLPENLPKYFWDELEEKKENV
jgi:ribosomal protein S27AE